MAEADDKAKQAILALSDDSIKAVIAQTDDETILNDLEQKFRDIEKYGTEESKKFVADTRAEMLADPAKKKSHNRRTS